MHIGIPKEIKIGEQRVALTPQACKTLIEAGHHVHIETEAGEASGYTDKMYTEAGCIIEDGANLLYKNSELIVKVKEPLHGDLLHVKPHHKLFCYLHLASSKELTESIQASKATAYAFETVVVDGKTPLLSPMSAIAGRTAVHIGAWHLHSTLGGRGTLLGGVSGHPAGKVVVIGAGVAGTEAVALAHGMGADVVVLDINPVRLQSLEKKFPGVQGMVSEEKNISEELKTADLVVGAVYVVGKRAPKVVTAEHIQAMPKGSVIVDISIDQGGCVEGMKPCTHHEPVYMEHGVIHSAITNLPAAAARTASEMLSQAILPYVEELASEKLSESLRKAINIENGILKIEL